MFSKTAILREWMRPKQVAVYESVEGYKLVLKLFRFGIIASVVLGLPVYVLLKILCLTSMVLAWSLCF